MKTTRLIFLTLIFASLLRLGYGQTKRALIFAIGNYPDESGWSEIASSRDDSLIQKALRDQKFGDIKAVENKAATVNGIKNALNELVNRSNPGDIVMIHFSSHGEQVEDLNGNKPDGLEESIVSYEAKQAAYGTEPTKEEMLKLREGYFLDNTFGTYVDKLRTKLGKKGDILVLMDLCYAGTGTRGMARVRGGRPPLVSRGFYSRKHEITEDSKQVLRLPDESNMASYVVIGAARANESDNETTDDNKHSVGPLSYAVSKVFATLDSGMTYRSLFARIQSIMNEKLPQQHPVLSGNGVDRKLFAGNFVTQKPYVTIEKINGRQMTLKAGKYAGLDPGAKISVYPAGTTNPKGNKPLATGTVISSEAYRSDVHLDADLGVKQAVLSWVFVTEKVFKTDPLNVAIANNIGTVSRGKMTSAFSPNEVNSIERAVRNLPGAKLSNRPDINIARGKGTNIDTIVISSTGMMFDTIARAAKDTNALKNKIKAYIQYSFLKNMNVDDPEAELEVKLLPVINGKPDTNYIHQAKTSFNDGDKMMVWVNNRSRHNLFINILDIQPNGVINAILPNNSQRIAAEDLMVPAGSSFLFKNYVITIGPPYGKEIFKIFACGDKIDLEDIAGNHGEGKRGGLHPFEILVKRSFDARDAAQKVSADIGSSYNLYFDIKPKP
jgi:metacaspase-1